MCDVHELVSVCVRVCRGIPTFFYMGPQVRHMQQHTHTNVRWGGEQLVIGDTHTLMFGGVGERDTHTHTHTLMFGGAGNSW